VTIHSAEYSKVISSARWKKLRLQRIASAKGRCERCGRWPTYSRELELHHRTYERLGNELPDDVELLCVPCHKVADRQREHATAVRSWDRAVEGWARKVYGDEGLFGMDWDVVEARFERWLERKDPWRL